MSHRYDHAVAHHYAAFRPPLHELILSRLAPPPMRYENGLDVGCGTGRSAVALARLCRHVTAIDPSPAMLALAARQPGIDFVVTDAPGLAAIGAGPFACITFAGSLVYAKGPALRAALPRLLAPGGHILIYDFEVLLDEVTAALGLRPAPTTSPYDHTLGLADWPEFGPEMCTDERIALELTNEQLAHVVLADSDRYDQLQNARDASPDPFPSTVRRLAERISQPVLRAHLYYARYHMTSLAAAQAIQEKFSPSDTQPDVIIAAPADRPASTS